jgi:uncharacterized membrane protein (UPF0182 family)
VFYGAGYTDLHARLLAITVTFALAALVGLLLLSTVVTRNYVLPAAVAVLWLVASVLLGGLYPGLIQRYVVEPNEFVREQPYIDNNIAFTRQAYRLDAVLEQDVDPRGELTAQALANNQATIRNTRLWDYRPLLQTYSQLQAIRSYYDFVDVDIDRYRLGNDYRQVMLAARQLAPERLRQRTWVNDHIQFTHGYGFVMSPVNEIGAEGQPVFFVRDIPPRATVDLPITRPEIYFGDRPEPYVFVKTRDQEFDYPQGDSNVRTTYQGTGGVRLDSALTRLAFASRFAASSFTATSTTPSAASPPSWSTTATRTWSSTTAGWSGSTTPTPRPTGTRIRPRPGMNSERRRAKDEPRPSPADVPSTIFATRSR